MTLTQTNRRGREGASGLMDGGDVSGGGARPVSE